MYGSRVLLLKEGRLLNLGLPQEVMTFESLEDAYGCRLLVDASPIGSFPRITLVPERYMKPESTV